MPRGIKKQPATPAKVLDAKTERGVLEHLTESAFIQMYAAFKMQKADKTIAYSAVIDGETFELILDRKIKKT